MAYVIIKSAGIQTLYNSFALLFASHIKPSGSFRLTINF
jgi:hypothetical protein